MTRIDGDGWPDMDVLTADRLLDGSLAEFEVPYGYEEVACLVGVVRHGTAPATAVAVQNAPTVRAMAEVVAASAGPPRLSRGPAGAGRRPHRLPQVVAVVAFVAMGGGYSAAAMGSLPAPMQAAAHFAAAQLGWSVPPARSYASTAPGGHAGDGHRPVLGEPAAPAVRRGDARRTSPLVPAPAGHAGSGRPTGGSPGAATTAAAPPSEGATPAVTGPPTTVPTTASPGSRSSAAGRGTSVHAYPPSTATPAPESQGGPYPGKGRTSGH